MTNSKQSLSAEECPYARGVSERHGRGEEQFCHDVSTFIAELNDALSFPISICPTPGDDKPLGIEEVVERVARHVYDAMRWAATTGPQHREGKTPDWVERGNSLAQGQARSAARAAIEAYEQARASTGGNHDQQ